MVAMFQLMRISLNVYQQVQNNERLFGSGDGFLSALDYNLFQLHLRCCAQTFTWLQLL